MSWKIAVLMASVAVAGCSQRQDLGPARPQDGAGVTNGSGQCDVKDVRDRPVEFLGVDKAAALADGFDLCAIARDLVELLDEENRAAREAVCSAVTPDEVREAERILAKYSPEEIQADPNIGRFAQMVGMCSESGREAFLQSTLSPPIVYSVGYVEIDGVKCPAYLRVLEAFTGPMAGSTGYLPRFLGTCKGGEHRLEAQSFHPENRPTGVRMGDLLKDVSYSGPLPSTWTLRTVSYSFSLTEQERALAAMTEIPEQFRSSGECRRRRHKEIGGPYSIDANAITTIKGVCRLRSVKEITGNSIRVAVMCDKGPWLGGEMADEITLSLQQETWGTWTWIAAYLWGCAGIPAKPDTGVDEIDTGADEIAAAEPSAEPESEPAPPTESVQEPDPVAAQPE